MMMAEQHSDYYYLIVNQIEHPTITFVQALPKEAIPDATRQTLHSFINHHYIAHDLSESEADDLHQYVDEKNYQTKE